VASELNLEEWQVRRAIAVKLLSASTVGGGKVRVTSDELQKALAKADSTGGFDGPPIHNGWIDDREESHRANMFARKVREEIAKQIPETMPATDQTVAYSGGIKALGDSPPSQRLIAHNGQKELPYASTAELYVVSQVRREAFIQVKDAPSGGSFLDRSRQRTPLARLYSSPEEFDRVISLAVSLRVKTGQ